MYNIYYQMKSLIKLGILFFFINDAYCQDSTYFFKDSTNSIPLSEISKVKFNAMKNSAFGFPESKACYWLKIKIINNEDKAIRKYIEINSPWLDEVDFYNPNFQLINKFSWKTPLARRAFAHQNFILPIEIYAQNDSLFYVRFFRKQMVIIGGVKVYSESEFFEKKMLEKSIFSIFTGIILFVSIFAFFMFFPRREPIYLWYGIYSLSNLFFVQTLYANYLPLYLNNRLKVPAFQVNELFSWVTHLAIFLFIRAFLFGKKPFSKPLKIVWASTLIVMPIILILKFYYFYLYNKNLPIPKTLLIINALGFLLSVLSSFVLLFYAYTKKQRLSAANTYLVGIFPLGIFAILTYLRNLNIISHSWWLESEVQIACVLWDVMVLMIALGIRYKIINDEKEKQVILAYETGIQMQNQERSRLAKELHDGVGIDLSIVKMKLESLKIDFERKNLTNETNILSDGIKNIDEITSDIRSFSHNLIPPDLENNGIVGAIQHLVTNLNKAHQNIEINFTTNVEENLENNISQNIYFIVKELVNNTLRHAKAKIIDIELMQEEKQIELRIADDGMGYNFEEERKKGGLGLRSIQSRVELMRAQFEVKAKPLGGVLHQIFIRK